MEQSKKYREPQQLEVGSEELSHSDNYEEWQKEKKPEFIEGVLNLNSINIG